MATSDVTVIVPQFGSCHLTDQCVRSFRAAHGPEPRLFVVDDGTHPAELDLYRPRLHATAELLERTHAGVTAAWNAGLEASHTAWLAFLNNDAVTHGRWLEALLAPLLSGAAEMTGVEWRIERHLPVASQTEDDSQVDRGNQRQLLAGWCFAIARERLLDLGGFDPALELYFSDTDLQLRLQASSRFIDPLHCVEHLPLVHRGHQTAHRLPDQRRQWSRDRRRFQQKWLRTSATAANSQH